MLQSIFSRIQRPPTVVRNPQTQSLIKDITPAELYQKLQSNEPLLLVDVRFPDEYAAGHILGSRLLPLPHLRQRSRELPQDLPIVCICRSGRRSLAACEQLANQGFTELMNLSGGMLDWDRAQLPVQR